MLNLSQPIITNNRNLRKKDPSVKKHFEECKKDALSFPQIDGVVKNRKFVDFVKCPLKHSGKKNNYKDLFVKWGFIHSECKICRHVFVRNRLKREILSKLYDKSKADILSRKRKKHNIYNSYMNKVYLKYLSFLINKKKKIKLLDVGCGDGTFLKFTKMNFENVSLYGSEFTNHVYKYLKKLLETNFFYKQELSEIKKKIDFKFDIITFWGVLEHLTDPLSALKNAEKILEANGKILVNVPCYNSRARKILGISTPTLNPREHLHFFSQKSMKILANKSKLKIFKFSQELPIIDLMYPHIKYSKKFIADIVKKKECYNDVYILVKNN